MSYKGIIKANLSMMPFQLVEWSFTLPFAVHALWSCTYICISVTLACRQFSEDQEHGYVEFEVGCSADSTEEERISQEQQRWYHEMEQYMRTNGERESYTCINQGVHSVLYLTVAKQLLYHSQVLAIMIHYQTRKQCAERVIPSVLHYTQYTGGKKRLTRNCLRSGGCIVVV